MNKKELIKELRKQVDIVQRVISDWRSLHGELNDVLLFFEKIGFDEGRKIILKISDVESRLVEEAVEEFTPLFYELKEKIFELIKKLELKESS